VRAAALALLAGTLTITFALGSATAAGPSGRSLSVRGGIESISAERGLVAIHVHPPSGCDYAAIWKPSTGAVSRVEDCSSSDAVLQDLALAGGAAIWWDWSSGNHVYCDDVYRSRGGKAHPLGICDGTEGDTYYELAGDSTLVAISDYSVCEADCTDANGNLLPDGDYAVEVRRLGPDDRLTTVLAPRDFRTFLDARGWRIAVIEPKATLTVYDSRGAKLWSRPGVTGVRNGWIVGNAVALEQSGSVRLYSPAGAGPSRALPKGARVDGVVGGLAVYRTGSTVHLLRLADGRDRRLVTVKGLVEARITPAGVFYAAGSSVAFVPIRTALQKLR
jgi:hypothetical protein